MTESFELEYLNDHDGGSNGPFGKTSSRDQEAGASTGYFRGSSTTGVSTHPTADGDDGIDRVTFGLDRLTIVRLSTKMRLTDLILLGFLVLYYFTVAQHLKPFERQFYVGDLTISHPFAEVERVTARQLFFYVGVMPICIITFLGFSLTYRFMRKVYVTYVSLLGLFLSLFITNVLTDISKNYIGRHRPDFLARCMPALGAPENVLVFAADVCTTNSKDRLMDGFRTTPSGHSSLAWAGLGYLSFWLSGQLIITDSRTGIWRSVASWGPCLGALVIGLTRTEDYRHHFVDVILGSILGFSISWWTYRRYFPALTAERCYEPYGLVDDETKSYERLEGDIN